MSIVRRKDLTGQKFGRLTVLSFSDKNNEETYRYANFWDCQCDCGIVKAIRQTNLLRDSGTKSCGCLIKGRSLDLIGQKFGKLLVIGKAEPIVKTKRKAWLCECECGKTITAAQTALRDKTRTKSCGCDNRKTRYTDLTGKRSKTRYTDFTGMRIGKLVVIGDTEQGDISFRHRTWKCQCDCGNIISMKHGTLKANSSRLSCGCDKDLVGSRFGNLVITSIAKTPENACYEGEIFWNCECDCGNSKVVRQYSLTKVSGTKSCGCLSGGGKDYTGIRLGRLRVVKKTKLKKNHLYYWECLCDCGEVENKLVTQLIQNQKKPGYIAQCSKCVTKGRKEKNSFKPFQVFDTNISKISPDRPLPKHNTSGVVGVHYSDRLNRWVACIIFQKKKYYLGSFAKKEDAVKARKEAEEIYFENFLEWYENYREKP